jgi:hypothetical protein
LERSDKAKTGASAVALREGGLPKPPSYGSQASFEMYYVYLLQSESHPTQQYIGLTRELRQRLRQHNNACSPHTKKFCPWTLVAYFAFKDEVTLRSRNI